MSRSVAFFLLMVLMTEVQAPEPPVLADGAITIAQGATPSCSSCSNARSRQRTPEEMQRGKLRLEQDKILHKLRLLKPPNVRLSMNDLPSPLLKRLKADNEEFDKSNTNLDSFYVRTHYSKGFDENEEMRRRGDEDDEKDDPLTAKTKGVYIFSQRPRTGDTITLNCPDVSGRTAACLEFKLNGELLTRHITTASLWVYKTTDTQSGKNRTLEITEIQRAHLHHSSHTELWVADVPLTDGPDGWLEIDLTDHVTRWHRSSATGDFDGRHRRLRVSCSGCANSAHAPIALIPSFQPFLEVKLGNKVETATNKQSRNRRSSTECSPHLYSNCCLKPFYVNFSEIGWNSWILQPPGYYANYCTGSCRMTATTSYNNIIRNVGKTKEARGEAVDQELVPCCAPTKMMSLSLLYAFSPGEIMKKTLENMIVESCGC